MANGLTDKQKVWIDEYLKSWNATDAARQAGYKNPLHSGHENRQKPYMQAEISKRLSASAMSADEVLERLGNQARADPADFFIEVETETGPSPQVDWQRILNGESGGVVKSISPTRDGWKLELYDAQTALVHIGKHHGIFTERIDLTSKGERIGTDADDIAEAIALLDAARETQAGESG